jgi:hypothetical protein
MPWFGLVNLRSRGLISPVKYGLEVDLADPTAGIKGSARTGLSL